MKFKVWLKIAWYIKNGNLFIRLDYENNGYSEPFGKLTVNTGVICSKGCAFIDIYNLPEEILPWIVSHKLAVPTGRYTIDGYPEYHFDAKILRKFDPDGYSSYLANLSD